MRLEVHRQTDGYHMTLAACLTSHKCVCCDILGTANTVSLPLSSPWMVTGHTMAVWSPVLPSKPQQAHMLTLGHALLFSLAWLLSFN